MVILVGGLFIISEVPLCVSLGGLKGPHHAMGKYRGTLLVRNCFHLGPAVSYGRGTPVVVAYVDVQAGHPDGYRGTSPTRKRRTP